MEDLEKKKWKRKIQTDKEKYKQKKRPDKD